MRSDAKWVVIVVFLGTSLDARARVGLGVLEDTGNSQHDI